MLKQITIFSFFALVFVILAGCVTPGLITEPSKTDYGLSTYSSYDEEPLTIGASTKAYEFNGRIFYFKSEAGLKNFMLNPQPYIQKYSYNATPKIASPLISDYGLKTSCSYDVFLSSSQNLRRHSGI